MDWTAFEQLLKTSAVYGLAFVFTAGVLLGILWLFWEVIKVFRNWAPVLAQRHITFLDGIQDSSERSAKAVETLAMQRTEDHSRTARAIGHFARAAKASTDNPQVHLHIDRVIEEVKEY